MLPGNRFATHRSPDVALAPESRAERMRLWFARRVVSPLQGVTFRSWHRLLDRREIEVHPEYVPRAIFTRSVSLVNSLDARAERRRFGRRIARTRVARPVFILGHYRSGTTHLHNLLAQDDRMAAPSYHEVTFPSTFLVGGGLRTWLGPRLAPRRRPYDNVALGFGAPAEDELALCATTFLSPHMCWHFPRSERRYRRYLSFREATGDERRTWVRALRTFARKLIVRRGPRIPVFKSPCHTARIPLLLEAFPDARFVHLHRDPWTVFQSTENMERSVGDLFQYQRRDSSGLQEFILWRYRHMYDAFLEDREQVPDGRLVEVSYDELIADPEGTLRRIYAALDLPDFASAAPGMQRYLDGIRGYRRNRYAPLGAEIRARILREWAPCFAAWGYGGPRGSDRSAGAGDLA